MHKCATSDVLPIRSVEKYVLGSGKRLEIEVEVQNEGEDAFESSFELQVPTGLNYVKIERKDESEREIPVQCSPPSFGNNFTLRCDIGNPLPRDKLVKFSVLLQPYQQKTMTPTYEFSMSVNSTNPEKNRTVSDNLVVFRVPIWVVTELAISGSSRPVDVYFNSSQYIVDETETEITKESEIGPQVAHLYTITNKGPSEFLKARATILWPSNTLTGEPLLYLLEPPETSGNVECFVEYDEYNVRKLKIDRKGKSFFDSELGETGALSSSSSHESSSSSGGSGSTYTSKSTSSSSWSSSSNSKSGGSRVELTREERLKFEEDERRREEEAIAHETGDGSHRHIERARARAKDSQHYSQNGGRLESDSYSHGSETSIRERGRTETSRNPSVNSKAYEEEMYSRHSSSSSQSGNAGPVTKSRSSERKSSTTWGRDGTGKTVSSWREEEDGVVRNGSTVVEHGGETRRRGGNRHSGVIQRTHERNSTRTSTSRGSGASGLGYADSFERDGASRNSGSAVTSTSHDRRTNWRVEGEGMTRSKDGTVVPDEATLDFESRGSSAAGDSSSRRGQGSGGSRSSSEERRSEWNTTWTSGGRPVTSEHTSWKVEQDGKTVGSGANRRTYEGTADASKAELESRLKEQLERRIGLTTHSTSASNGELDHNLIGVGDTKYTKEWEEQYNTTSGSSTGGKPITVAKTKWRIEDNGNVRTGGDTKTYEGVPPGFDNTRLTIPSSESTRHHGEASSQGADGSFESHHESSSHHESRAHSSRGGSVGSGTSEEGSFHTDRDGSRRRVGTGVTGIGRSTIIRTTEVKEEEERRSSGRGGSHHGHGEGTIRGEDALHGSRGGLSGATLVETSRTITTQGGSERRRGHHFSTADEGDDDSRTVEERRRLAEAERRRTHHESGVAVGEASAEESEDRRSHHVRTESSHSQAEGSARGHHRGSIARTESEQERRIRLHGSSDTAGSEESVRREEESHRSRGSSFAEAGTERRQYGHGESHLHGSDRRTSYGSGSSDAASAVGHSSGAASSFDWGAVARGPGDGKARTYVSDLGILSGGSERSGSSTGSVSGSSVGSAAETSSSYGGHSSTHHSAGAGADEARRHHSSSSRERHYSFESGSGTRDGSSDEHSGRAAEFSGGSRSRTNSGGSETRYSSSRTHSSAERNFEGDPDLDPDYESRRAGSSSSSSYSSSRSYSSRGGSSYGTAEEGSSDGHRSITNPDDRQGFRHYRRERRYADEYDNYGYDEYEEEDAKRCPGPVRCTRIICDIGALKKDQEVHVAVRSRLWVATIKKIAPHVETLVGSEMTAKVTLLPTIGRPSSKTMTKNSTEVKTRIMVEPVATPDVVPLWIVVLSAVSGALILMLLVYILYKLGFFKRNRPEPASAGSEKTPLNRNGHYQGDEHL
ncbi:integrin [Nesidiocoris tenuis]|uniref:Integrin n=1 Tax=Nesidiocoris tenuis TaxID=355587 RepID=A0ABN7BIF6_9HEMI|nr:integrin [Nesidiocoris tenuis]